MQRSTVEIKDLDEVTTRRDICEAIKAQYNIGVAEADVLSLRKAYGGMQIATVGLPAEKANKLLESGKIKVGWVNCRIRVRKALTKCFRCLEFGHTARQCKSEHDREEGHIAKKCKKDALCFWCKMVTPENAGHVAGSSKCPVLKKALAKLI